MNHLSPRKNASSDAIINPRDNYRRSESYSAVQARSFQNLTQSNHARESPKYDIPYSQQEPSMSLAQSDSKQDSWRESDQHLLNPQQRDHSKREKHKRESFYAALPNSSQESGVDHGGDSKQEESRRIIKALSRTTSPHLPSGIPLMRTKSRGTQPSTPSADSRTRPTPSPRSQSRTPGGGYGLNAHSTVFIPQQPQVPQQYSAEIQPIVQRPTTMILDDGHSGARRPDAYRSPSTSTPSSQSETPLPPTADTFPVPVADITKHLSGLEFKEQTHISSNLDLPASGTHLRHPSSGSMTSSLPAHRRSLVFDLPNSHGRTQGTEQGGRKSKDNAKERSYLISSSQGSARKRGKTLSAMDPPKEKPSPPILPPMYMSTSSRTSNIPSPMASRLHGSKIPSSSGMNSSGRGGVTSSRDGSKALSTSMAGHPMMSPQTPSYQDVKTIRGGGMATENPALSFGAPMDNPISNNTTVASASPGSSRSKPNRSFSSGILGVGGRKPQSSTDSSHQFSEDPSTKKLHPVPRVTVAPNSSRHSLTSAYVSTQPELKKTPTSGLRTPTAVKEMRSSPSKTGHKQTAHSGPIQLFQTNQPTLLYGQGPSQPSAAVHASVADSKVPYNSASGTSPSLPLTPYAALKLYGAYLSLYERAEIGEYPQIYYVGQNCRQKKAASVEASNSNFGYDDERGDYLIVNHDHLMFRYEVLDMLGKGSFGQVAKCYDHKTGEYVAIKIIRNKMRFHCQAMVEVKILGCLTKWDPEDKHNLIRMTDSFYFRNHLCIATELLSINLYEFIKSNSFNGSSLGLIKRFCTQLLQSLELLGRHNVVHCDLKPENVLLTHDTKSSIKVIDFGSSCFENEKVYTYIQSRFYRSPEVILGMSYNMAIDMWSLGCILAELYTGYPLFPGENEQEQLSCIMEIQGVPERHLIEKSSRRKIFF
ncbi:hypothetical protein BGZ94_003314, partial [Podila epigama]